MKESITIRLDPEQVAFVDRLGKSAEWSRSQTVRFLVNEAMRRSRKNGRSRARTKQRSVPRKT